MNVAWATWRVMAETCVFWWDGICVSLDGKRCSGGHACPSLPLPVACSEQKHRQTHTPKPYFLEYEWSSNTSLKRHLSQASTQALKRWILIFAVVWQIDTVFTNICRHSMIKQMPPVLQQNARFIFYFTHKYLCCSVFESCWVRAVKQPLQPAEPGALPVHGTSSPIWAQR